MQKNISSKPVQKTATTFWEKAAAMLREKWVAAEAGTKLASGIKATVVFVTGLIIILGSAGIIRMMLQYAIDLHRGLGLLVALLVLAAILWFLKYIKKQSLTPLAFGSFPRVGLALNLLLAVLVTIVVMATISSILYDFQWVNYTSKDPVTIDRLLDYYSWHFIDSIPVLKIWQLAGVEYSRISAADFGTRFLLEFFRVLIVAAAIRTFLNKSGDFKRQLLVARAYRVKEDYKSARRTLQAALKSAARVNNTIGLADVHLELARLCADMKEEVISKEHLNMAGKWLDRAEQQGDIAKRRAEIQQLSGQ